MFDAAVVECIVIKATLQLVLKFAVSQEKIKKLKEFGVDNLIEIDADWILNQTKIPSKV